MNTIYFIKNIKKYLNYKGNNFINKHQNVQDIQNRESTKMYKRVHEHAWVHDDKIFTLDKKKNHQEEFTTAKRPKNTWSCGKTPNNISSVCK